MLRQAVTRVGKAQQRCYATLPPFDYVPPKYEGPSKAEVLQKRKTYLNPAIFMVYKEPVMITDAKMQYMYDETGNRYLDLFGGITTISAGHCHPEVVKATVDQVQKVTHTTTIYLNNQIAQYAEELAAKFPDPLKVVYFVNSGSEANDLAVLMSRIHTGVFDFIGLRNGYHGMSDTMMGLTALSNWKPPTPQGKNIY
jgi:alanine-glyoxylate transaminase / (R)-3-amino-2-methylpropionate-pyruvate transaminase